MQPGPRKCRPRNKPKKEMNNVQRNQGTDRITDKGLRQQTIYRGVRLGPRVLILVASRRSLNHYPWQVSRFQCRSQVTDAGSTSYDMLSRQLQTFIGWGPKCEQLEPTSQRQFYIVLVCSVRRLLQIVVKTNFPDSPTPRLPSEAQSHCRIRITSMYRLSGTQPLILHSNTTGTSRVPSEIRTSTIPHSPASPPPRTMPYRLSNFGQLSTPSRVERHLRG